MVDEEPTPITPPLKGEITFEAKKTRREPREYSQVLKELKPSNRVMSAFMVQPEGVRIEIQEQEEKILLLVREHFITNWKWILLVIFLLLVPGFFSSVSFWSLFPVRFQAMTLVLWYMMTLTVAIEGFLGWYLDILAVTDERLIDIDFKGLIYKNITTAKIDDIQDVTFSINGPLGSIFDYGNVLVQTAGAVVTMQPQRTLPTIEIWNTPKPAIVSKLINEVMLEEEQEKLEGRAH
jgi:membrane protein YdbS with pleckstrin-like domain